MRPHTDTCRSRALELGWGWSRPAGCRPFCTPLAEVLQENRQGSTALVNLPPRRTIDLCSKTTRHLEILKLSAVSNAVGYAVSYTAPSPGHLFEQDDELPISKLHSCALRGRRSSPSSSGSRLSTYCSCDFFGLSFPVPLPHKI